MDDRLLERLQNLGKKYGCPIGIEILDFLDEVLKQKDEDINKYERIILEGKRENDILMGLIDQTILHSLQAIAKKHDIMPGVRIPEYLDQTIDKLRESLRVALNGEEEKRRQVMKALAERDKHRDDIREIAMAFGAKMSDGPGMVAFLKELSRQASQDRYIVAFDPAGKASESFSATQTVNMGNAKRSFRASDIINNRDMGPGLLEQIDLIFHHGTEGRRIRQEHPYGAKAPSSFSGDSPFTADKVYTGFDQNGLRWAGHYNSHTYDETSYGRHGVMFITPIALVLSDNIALLMETVELYNEWSEKTNDDRLFLEQNERLRVEMEPATQPSPQANWKEKSPAHYGEESIQPAEYIERNGLDFFQGNVVKYVTRHKAKDGVKDIKKAIHYLEMILENQYPKTNANQPERGDRHGPLLCL